MYTVYMLLLGDRTIYTGITTDLKRRVAEHRDGRGARYTRGRKIIRVLYTEKCKNRSAASIREAEIKGWSRAEKWAFVRSVHKKKRSRKR